jgi:hypothetical protein
MNLTTASELQATRVTASLITPAPATSSPTRAAASSLLPEPSVAGLDGAQDAMAAMYTLVSQQGQLELSTGERGVSLQNREQQAQAQRQEAALKQQEADEAKMNTGGGLFGSICHIFEDFGKDMAKGELIPIDAASDTINMVDDPHFLAQLEAAAPDIAEYVGIAAAVIGAVALTVCTAGAGGVIVAAVVIGLSASGMLVSKTHCLGKDSGYIGLGLEIASAVVSCGASSGMAAGGALQTAATVAQGASGTADVLAGASTIVVGNEQADVQNDAADVQAATVQLNRNARLLADLVAGMKDAQQSNKNSLQVLAGAAQTYNQTLTLASATKA